MTFRSIDRDRARRSMRPHVLAWWGLLTPEKRERVRAWVRQNPPPDEWKEGNLDWAFTKMPWGPP